MNKGNQNDDQQKQQQQQQRQDQQQQRQQQQQQDQDQDRFPITKAKMCGTNPKFPYRDVRHYSDPCCDFPKRCQLGYAAQLSLSKPLQRRESCHSPELAPSHPWFDPSA